MAYVILLLLNKQIKGLPGKEALPFNNPKIKGLTGKNINDEYEWPELQSLVNTTIHLSGKVFSASVHIL